MAEGFMGVTEVRACNAEPLVTTPWSRARLERKVNAAMHLPYLVKYEVCLGNGCISATSGSETGSMESEQCFNSGRHAHGTGGQRPFTHGRKRVILLSCGSVDTAPAFSSVFRGGRTRTITLTRSEACCMVSEHVG